MASGASSVKNSPEGFGPSCVAVQRTVYDLSSAIFDYCPPSLDISSSIPSWRNNRRSNSAGAVPELFSFETRVGASLALLGYLESAPTRDALVSVLANAGTLRIMEPVLKQHEATFKKHKVAFQVASVEYDLASGKLVDDTAVVARVARSLGLPLFTSTLATKEDLRNASVLTSVAAQLGPAIHVFDGIRGVRQSVPINQGSGAYPKISAAPKSLEDVFEVTNAALGTKLQPFEYHGSPNATTVLVTLSNPAAIAAASLGENIACIHVRLYSPFLSAKFLETLPKSVKKIVVVDSTPELYSDVSASLFFHFGFGQGPSVEHFITVDDELSPSDILSSLGSDAKLPSGGVKLWDSDKAASGSAANIIAHAPYSTQTASIYTVYDNLVAGGVTQSDLTLEGHPQFWPLDAAKLVLVNEPTLIKSYDVISSAAVNGNVVVAAANSDALDKALTSKFKLDVAAKKLNVYTIDLNSVDQSGTEGRTVSFVAQAVIWLLGSPELDIDTVTSRIVHANGQDTELVAATINKLVNTVKTEALVKVDTSKWEETEASSEHEHLPGVAAITSFRPVARETEKTETVTQLRKIDLAKRIAFREAYHEKEVLRPDVSARTVIAKVKLNERVTPSDYDRHIFHLELDISGTGLKYAIGEALGIHSPNNVEGVRDFISWYGLDSEEVVGVPHRDSQEVVEYKTVYQVLRDNLDLFGKVPKRFYAGLATYATDEAQKTHLSRLAGPEGAEELKKRTEESFDNYVDVLQEFSSAHPPFSDLVELIAPLKRREYSIASSQKMHPNEVHLLVVVVDWESKRDGKKRYGQCSKYLSDLHAGEEVVVSVKPSVLKLPTDTTTPIIMAGLGTGLAPFKAFLEEKLWQKQQGNKVGEVYLFLGSRHQRQEYLYGELFEAYKAAGILTYIGAAFSRDQPEKIYIQHRIREAENELIDAFVKKGGTFYLCGPTWPVPDISAALTDIVTNEAASRNEKVDDSRLIEDLKEAERYILEVY